MQVIPAKTGESGGHILPAMDFGQRFKTAREYADMSRERVATALGVKYESVRQWEAGETTPRVHRHQVIADLFGVRLAWLSTGQGQMVGETDYPSATEVSEAIQSLPLSDQVRLLNEIAGRLAQLDNPR